MNSVKMAKPATAVPKDSPVHFVTTINYLHSPAFAARARLIKRPSPGQFKDALSIIRRVLQAARQEDILLLASSWGHIHPDLLSAAIIGLWPRRMRPMILMLGCMWEPNKGIRGSVERRIIKMANRAIDRYLVQSSEEMTIFPRIWRISPEKVHFCPFFFELSDADINAAVGVPAERYVFAGGNSHRDYGPLVEAARTLPDLQFILATQLLNGRTDLPPNVKAGPVSHNEYMGLLHHAAANVVAIQRGLRRAAGQRTYLNSMWLQKPTLVTDTLGVHDHIRHMETGLIVDGSSDGYVEALKWVFDPHNEEAVQCLVQQARQSVQENFTLETHVDRVLYLIDDMVQEKRGGSTKSVGKQSASTDEAA